MKIINWWIDQFGIGGLVIGSIFSFIGGIILLLSTIFNFPPYITFSKGSKFGMTDYSKGIPVSMNIPISIKAPDTNIVIRTKNGTWTNFHLSNNVGEKEWHLPQNDSIVYSDTIFSNIEAYDPFNKMNSLSTTFEIESGKIYIKPVNFKQRIMFNLPTILKFLLIGFCAWQIAMVLSFIRTGEAFTNKNFKRIASVGWSLIIYPLILILIELLFEPAFVSMQIHFTSSIPDYRQPISLNANVSSQINMVWIIIGSVFLITAQAFQKGYKLQQEQDLTI